MLVALALALPLLAAPQEGGDAWLVAEALPALPDALGVAGPFVGVHEGALIVAGGANFPVGPGQDLWEVPKVYHDRIHVLTRDADGYRWHDGGTLPAPVAYGACVSLPEGVLCIGGNDSQRVHDACYLLRWDPARQAVEVVEDAPLPGGRTHAAAAVLDGQVWVLGGQTGLGLSTATDSVLLREPGAQPARGVTTWVPRAPLAGRRALHLAFAQHDGFRERLFVAGGRRQDVELAGLAGIVPLKDVQVYDAGADSWERVTDLPRPVMGGAAVAHGAAHVFVLTGDDGSAYPSMIADAEYVKTHPGFPAEKLAYHTITDTWTSMGVVPGAAVTTPAVRWGEKIVLASGEARPRVRTDQVWSYTVPARTRSFGATDVTVLVLYLATMLAVGASFLRRTRDTDDYFRGGQRVAWWAAGCSIFATMLSSITYMAIPAKAFAQDWVYLVGSFLILAVAPLAVFVALPFFRRLDATSAYEYLEQRFHRGVRVFASGLFATFHVFRMAIVMSLAGLALAVATPWSASVCVGIMGALSIAYCTLGGIEAVIWTDTIQTAVLLGGALVCLVLMVNGAGGAGEVVEVARAHDKLRMANLHLDPTSASLALWVVVIGALGQNVSSYTSDQAVVQRYMTTPTRALAARSIWFATVLAIPASLLFFGLGTGLFAYYEAHPERLDPTGTTDQIFPLFIVNELPAGAAGLIVAGIFAAAQSTISTSMNSTATTLVTDFLRPMGACRDERGYLRAARGLTLVVGVVGTALGLLFVSPDIKSLFDQFIRVIGLFMGVLGGLFGLGILTRRASGAGAMVGVMGGAALLFTLPLLSDVNGYLYATTGVTACFGLGYAASLVLPGAPRDLGGLTIHTQEADAS